MSNYENDHRVRVQQNRWYESFDEAKMTVAITLENEEGEEETHTLSVKFEVCDTCEGKGRHVNPSIDCDGLTFEDFAEDPDFAEKYFGGAYDVPCYECSGRRVVPVLANEADRKLLLKRHLQKHGAGGFCFDIAF